MEYLIKATEEFVRARIKDFDSGHDWWHIERVRKLASYINNIESIADPFILDLVSLLHDYADHKFKGSDPVADYERIRMFLKESGLAEIEGRLIDVIKNVSFSSKSRSGDQHDPLLLVLQDADRLDAMGAIGIARAFNYGGFRNNAIYIPVDNQGIITDSTIGHFYDKLLKLKDMMNTLTGKQLAERRHDFMEMYLNRFYEEWEFGG